MQRRLFCLWSDQVCILILKLNRERLTSVVMNEGDLSQKKVSLPNKREEKQCFRFSEDEESIHYYPESTTLFFPILFFLVGRNKRNGFFFECNGIAVLFKKPLKLTGPLMIKTCHKTAFLLSNKADI